MVVNSTSDIIYVLPDYKNWIYWRKANVLLAWITEKVNNNKSRCHSHQSGYRVDASWLWNTVYTFVRQQFQSLLHEVEGSVASKGFLSLLYHQKTNELLILWNNCIKYTLCSTNTLYEINDAACWQAYHRISSIDGQVVLSCLWCVINQSINQANRKKMIFFFT